MPVGVGKGCVVAVREAGGESLCIVRVSINPPRGFGSGLILTGSNLSGLIGSGSREILKPDPDPKKFENLGEYKKCFKKYFCNNLFVVI